LPRLCDHTKTFAGDWLRLSQARGADMSPLKQAMLTLIANENPLGPMWRAHTLKGEWADHFECHLGGDFRLIYQIQKRGVREMVIVVGDAGQHQRGQRLLGIEASLEQRRQGAPQAAADGPGEHHGRQHPGRIAALGVDRHAAAEQGTHDQLALGADVVDARPEADRQALRDQDQGAALSSNSLQP
jgi:mRNA interferase YafQ